MPTSRPPAARATTLVLAALLAGCSRGGGAAPAVRVAVAASFAECFAEIAAAFEAETGHTTVVSVGSTGKLAAQIRHGAPFELFLAADDERPAQLVDEGRAAAERRACYAIGCLVLVGRAGDAPDALLERLRAGDFTRLAIANPELAPYGRAALEALDGLGGAAGGRVVRGENVAQVLQFVLGGAADLALCAASQPLPPGVPSVPIPPDLYTPVRQDAVLLHGASPAAAALFEFLRGDTARAIVLRHGLRVER